MAEQGWEADGEKDLAAVGEDAGDEAGSAGDGLRLGAAEDFEDVGGVDAKEFGADAQGA